MRKTSLQAPQQDIPQWILMMRQAAQGAISAEDVKAIVAAEVERAKKGDKDAKRFIFEQVLGGSAFRGATFIQNNYASLEEFPDELPGQPGSRKRMEAMQLVLTRRPGESVEILAPDGSRIARVVVIAVAGSRVRLGFLADPSIPILRDDALRRGGGLTARR